MRIDLRTIRIKLKISQERLGSLLGVSAKTIQRYENAEQVPDDAPLLQKLRELSIQYKADEIFRGLFDEPHAEKLRKERQEGNYYDAPKILHNHPDYGVKWTGYESDIQPMEIAGLQVIRYRHYGSYFYKNAAFLIEQWMKQNAADANEAIRYLWENTIITTHGQENEVHSAYFLERLARKADFPEWILHKIGAIK